MVVLANIFYPIAEIDLVCPTEDSKSALCLKLFFEMASVQTMSVWIFADSGTARKLISETFYSGLPFQPLLQQIADIQVVEGSKYLLDLHGFAISRTIRSVVLLHEYSIVRVLTIDEIVVGDVLIPNQCTL